MNTLFGKKSPTTLDVSGIGGTCTGHADVKVDIAVRLAGVFLQFRPQISGVFVHPFFPQGFFGLGDVRQLLSHQVAPEVHQLGRQRQGATGVMVWILEFGVKASPPKLEVGFRSLMSLISLNCF